MLRNLATVMLDEYKRARSKLDKSLIISGVTESIRQEGRFVKRHTTTKKWVIAEDLLCREKVSAVFRDALHERSRNSTSFFTQSALHQAEEERNQDYAAGNSSNFGMNEMDREEEKFNTVLDNLLVIGWTCRSVSPSLLGFERSSLASSLVNGNDPLLPLPRLGPQSSDKNDGFSIFAVAFANIAENGDPFEPKPFYEGLASSRR
jgi:hypothetical protein